MAKLAPEDDLPPPYSPGPTLALSSSDGGAFTSTPASDFSRALTSPLQSHLTSLPSRLRASQHAATTARDTRDLHLVTLLVPHISAFLADLGGVVHRKTGRSLTAELDLVPACAVPASWAELSGAEERRQEGEVVRVVRLDEGGDEHGSGEKGGRGPGVSVSGDGGEDGSGSPGWWWQDEDRARRLAAYLQPRQEPMLARRHIQAVVENKDNQKKGWSWGRKKPAQQPPLPAQAGAVPSTQASGSKESGAGVVDDRVSMTVRAEEVTFRKENEMGLWESMSGWGIVITVRVKPL